MRQKIRNDLDAVETQLVEQSLPTPKIRGSNLVIVKFIKYRLN